MEYEFKLSQGNSKLGNIININLPAIITCRKNAPCFKGCYALKNNYLFENVQDRLKKNLDAYTNNPIKTEKEILNQLPLYGFVRWHSSGDIVDKKYFQMMIRIAKKAPNVKFLCFTKKFEIVNDYISNQKKNKKKALPNNLTVVLSEWYEDYGLENPHNLPTTYVYDKKLDNEYPKLAIKCNGHCEKCFKCWELNNGESVVFDKH